MKIDYNQLIEKYKELIELLYQLHDLYRSDKPLHMSYGEWREKVIILQTEIKILEDGYRK